MAATTDASSPLSYPPSKTALILLDYQNFIVAHLGPGAQTAVANAKELQDWAHAKGVLTIHSIVNPDLSPPANVKDAARLGAWVSSLDAQDAAITIELNPIHVFKKRPGIVSGLKAEGIMDFLREKGIDSLLLCGFSTSGAVLRTAVPATDEGFVVSVVGDACADPKGSLHEMLLGEVLGSRAWVVGTGEVVESYCRA